MSKANELRKNAENCREQAQSSEGSKRARYNRMAESWNHLADTQDWIEGELPDRQQDSRSS